MVTSAEMKRCSCQAALASRSRGRRRTNEDVVPRHAAPSLGQALTLGALLSLCLGAASVHTARRPLSLAGRQSYVSRFGSFPGAYLHLQQEGQRHYEVPDLGVVSYYSQRMFGQINLICAPPLCTTENTQQLLDMFLAEVPGQMIFGGVDEVTARCLKSRGYQTAAFGTEFNIPIQEFRITGGHMKHLRRIQNLGKQGLEVREQTWNQVDQAVVRALSRAWLRARNGSQRELKGLTRPVEHADEWEVRKFYVYGPDKSLLGFAYFDPYFRDGTVIGYTANILRSWPGCKPNGLLDYAVLSALEKFRKEGIEELSLGLAPLHGLRREPGDNRPLLWLLKKIYELGEDIYPFQGVASHKLRWRAVEELSYACTKDVDPIRAVLCTLQVTNTI